MAEHESKPQYCSPTRFRKKPVVIEAMRVTDESLTAVVSWIYGNGGTVERSGNHNLAAMYIHTLEGKMAVRIGDFVIRGVKGEFYACAPEIFEMTYEAA